jgi:hypothetical protein
VAIYGGNESPRRAEGEKNELQKIQDLKVGWLGEIKVYGI